MGLTLLDKIWDRHVIKTLPNGDALLHVDRHIVMDLASDIVFNKLREAGREAAMPQLTFGVADHAVSSAPGRNDDTVPNGGYYVRELRKNAREAGFKLFDLPDQEQGIVHVVGPEQGVTLPGLVVAAGDSHTSTMGGVGALGFGVGASEIEHVLATQTVAMPKPKNMRVNFEGRTSPHVTPKDMILYMIGQITAGGATGHAIEYAGEAIRGLPVEGRLTICNMSIECGARVGMVAPDDSTFEFVCGRPFAPKGELWEQAVAYWRELPSDGDAVFDRQVNIDASAITPQVTWGTSPMDVVSVADAVPSPDAAPDRERKVAMEKALAYMDLTPGTPLEGIKIDWAFIGSCTNSRLSDLQAAADAIKGRKVAEGVRAMVVPGSTTVKSAAEAEGLDKVFLEAGFEWRESACSLCGAVGNNKVGPGERCISTSNRNFEGRQGAGARTHLASPAMVAAAAVTGAITDVRKLGN